MEKEIKVGIHNCFDFVRRDAKTGEVLGEYKAENIILNNFWAKYLSATTWDCLRYIHFGSGTVTPVATDVKLTTWLGYKEAPIHTSANTIYDFSKFYTTGVVSVKKSIRLEDTEYNGSFISEVGYSSATSSTTGLLTKALVKDMNGNVASIEKKSGEVLDIFATFFVSLGTGFDGGNIYFGQDLKITFAILWKMLCHMPNGSAWVTNYVWWLQGRPQPQNGSAHSSAVNMYDAAIATPTYDIPNKKVVLTLGNVTASNGNIEGGIRGISINGLAVNLPCTGFAQPTITKEVVGSGDGSNKDFQTKFGYVKNNGVAKVYVNDIEVSATIDYMQMYPKTNMINDLPVVDWSKIDGSGLPYQCTLLGAGTGVSNNWLIVENPLYLTVPIESIRGAYFTAYGSNDMTNWTQIAQRTGTSTLISISSGNQNFRYIKLESYSTSAMAITEINSTAAAALKNIHLTSAPASGATVAVTYQPDCIAKDDQHVLNNVKVTLTFNEYTP